MIIRANYNGLDKTSKSSLEIARLLNEEIDNMIGQITELNNIWDDEKASKEFINNTLSYLYYMKSIPAVYKKFGNIMAQMNYNYKVLDDDYAVALKKGVVDHEQHKEL